MIAEIWLAWDTDQRKLVETGNTLLTKILESVSTFVLLLSIILYYRHQIVNERNKWYIPDSITWRQNVWFFLAAELIVCGWHQFPTFGVDIYDDKYGVLMFCRVYLLVRVLRDFSPVYRKRYDLLMDRWMQKTGAVEFNWLLAVKFLFLSHMWWTVVFGVLISWGVMAYVIWIFEREGDWDEPFKLETSVWMTAITMTTVGYGDYSPTENLGKLSAGIAGILGIILSSLVVFAVMDSLMPSTQDQRVQNVNNRLEVTNVQRSLAARYIAAVFRFYTAKKEANGDRDSVRRITRAFYSKNTHFKGLLRACRREVTLSLDLDDLVISRLDEKLGSMTGKFSTRLTMLLGIRTKNRKAGLVSISDMSHQLDRLNDRQSIIYQQLDKIERLCVQQNESLF